MKFCSECNNMYYISISENDSNELIYYCRYCGHKDDSMENICVLKTQIKKGEQTFHHIINEYTKLDPTLPRLMMKCPNCKTENSEVIYIRYDDDNLKYIYICTECDTNWKT